MTKKQAIIDSIEHWKRMRKWVKVQIKQGHGNGFKDPDRMRNGIGENWFSDGCSLCEKYLPSLTPCRPCPLYKIGKKCEHSSSPWMKVAQSKKWNEWYKASTGMLQALNKALKENS